MLNTDKLLDAMSGIREEYVFKAQEVLNYIGEAQPKKRRKVLRTILIAAALVVALTGSAFAAVSYINSPAQAWKVAQQEIEAWKALGLLAPEAELPENPSAIAEQEEGAAGAYYFGRVWTHRYQVVAYESGDKYSINLDVDTATGKITRLDIEASADENDTPVPDGGMEIGGKTYYFYENYDDIFPPDITVDEYCALLAEYWGFSGYTLSGTEDSTYDCSFEAPSGDMLLKDLGTFGPNAYLTVYFDGDQEGVPMYVQLQQFPGRVCLMVGTNHAVG